MQLRLNAVTADNLRGYTSTTLPLNRSRTVVVGANNAGKTSLLKLLDWALNQLDLASLEPYHRLELEEAGLVLPARETRHKARRLTLDIVVPDGRSHKRFRCLNGVAALRFNIRLTPEPLLYLGLGSPPRGEQPVSSEAALELLARLRDTVRMLYVPAFRDAASRSFRATLLENLQNRVDARATDKHQGGSFKEYREVKNALASARKVVEDLTKPLWPATARHLPAGLTGAGRIRLTATVDDFVEWLTGRLCVTVSTGSHDAATVPLTELGSGLQSLLDLAVQRSELGKRQLLLVVEEPESFLHPSAQRVVTRSLLRDDTLQHLIVTTHSAVVVDEARFGEVVICRDQRFYYPREVSEERREEINSALLAGQGAEALFSRSLLLVEGEGDRLFFEKLRRRLATVDDSGRADELFVVAVGGKQSFGPWLRLLESYGSPTDRPISWLVVADGDAGADVRRAFNDAEMTLPLEVINQLGAVGQRRTESNGAWLQAISDLNLLTRQHGARFVLVPIDLENMCVSSCGQAMISKVALRIGTKAKTVEELLAILGSKAGNGAGNPAKAPWIRGYIGAHLLWSEWSPEIRDILRRWLVPVMSETAANKLLNNSELESVFE